MQVRQHDFPDPDQIVENVLFIRAGPCERDMLVGSSRPYLLVWLLFV